MTWLVSPALFLLGVYLSMRVLAALYRILDLWYTIGTAYPKVLQGILGWAGAAAAIAVLAATGTGRRSSGDSQPTRPIYFSAYALGYLFLAKRYSRSVGQGGLEPSELTRRSKTVGSGSIWLEQEHFQPIPRGRIPCAPTAPALRPV